MAAGRGDRWSWSPITARSSTDRCFSDYSGAARPNTLSCVLRIDNPQARVLLVPEEATSPFRPVTGSRHTDAAILIALNWSVLQGVCNSRLLFMPEAVRAGEWWRLFTHPFIYCTSR